MLTDAAVTPKRYSEDDLSFKIDKTKLKSNSANQNSGRKTTNESIQLFYSRNVSGPNDYQKDDAAIPIEITKSPNKTNGTTLNGKSIIIKKDGKSPYFHVDLEKIKHYINVPKSK